MAIKISGSTIIDDSRQLLNVGVSTFSGNIVPQADSSTDIGTNTVRFANIYGDTFYGSGANLTDVGFDPDPQGNLIAGTGAGANLDGTGCCNIFLGKYAGQGATSGDHNIAMGCCAASGVLTGGCNMLNQWISKCIHR